jgi:alkaline phosphatase
MRVRWWLSICGCLVLALVGLAPVSGAKPRPPQQLQPGCAAQPAKLPARQNPKNVILMIGDGMGPEHVELGSKFAGPLAMEELDEGGPGFATTDDYYGGITDSAASGTALATGCKTYYGAISVDINGDPLKTSWERAYGRGMATGILSSVFLVDATPGVWTAHTASRYNYSDIAKQQARSGVQVLLGAGASYYVPRGAYGTGDVDLIAEMQAGGYDYVTKATELEAANGPKLLGFFGGVAMTWALDRALDPSLTEPTLAQMTGKALELLSPDRDGFFLVVEGGGIDWLAHEKDPAGVMHEVAAFDEAVAVARAFADRHPNTLLIVTADHETGGLQDVSGVNENILKGMKATVESIWGAIRAGMDIDLGSLTEVEVGQAIEECDSSTGIADVLSERAGVTWGWGACDDGEHTATRVPVYATGPGASAFDGDLDNAVIGQLVLDAVA